MREILKTMVEMILPGKFQLHIRYLYLKLFNKLDPEMFFVSSLLENNRRFLDIGANVGVYSFYFRNIFRNIDAFEPIAEITYRLKSLQAPHIHIHNIALSNRAGDINLNIPIINGITTPARASIETRDSKNIKRNVKIRTVDSYDFDDIDLIKIDVEGHEESVIKGAQNTIKKTLPIILVEIEQRHINKNISEIYKKIIDMNYNGFFLDKGKLTSINNFNYEAHQKPFLENTMSREYINNFIFIPNKHKK